MRGKSQVNILLNKLSNSYNAQRFERITKESQQMILLGGHIKDDKLMNWAGYIPETILKP